MFEAIRQNRWWTYQRERFPVVGNGLLIAAFSFSAVSFSALLRSRQQAVVDTPSAAAFVVAFITAFLFFLQLRIADEFKDFDEDSRYRPYRPVPRGLIRLRELAALGLLAALVQLAAGLLLHTGLVMILLVVWIYLALMSREFFVRDWIKRRPVTYLWTHMLIMPLIDFYATACDWMPAEARPPAGLFWFLVVSFFNGIVIEIGRKIRAPQDEETGVDTYTALWGRNTALLAWLGALGCTAFSAVMASLRIGFTGFVIVMLSVLLLPALALCRRFALTPEPGRGRVFELYSGIWTLLMYLSLGIIPLVWRLAATPAAGG